MIIKLRLDPPFGAQIILNGHQYGAGQAAKAGLAFSKAGNCFRSSCAGPGLAQFADTLPGKDVGGQLSPLGDRWIYSSCLGFALTLAEQERPNFRYRYSTSQLEYSRNRLGQGGGQREQGCKGLIDRGRAKLAVPRLKTIFGRKRRPFRPPAHPAPRLAVVVEKPQYDLPVFKIQWGKLTVKLYPKGERVRPVEVIIHNPKALPYGRSWPNFPEIVQPLTQILHRFLNSLPSVDPSFSSADTLDTWHTPCHLGQTRIGGIHLDPPRLRAVIEAVFALTPNPYGFTASSRAAKVRIIRGLSAENQYTPRQAAYDLKKLRGKGWLDKIDRSRRYQPPPPTWRS